MAEHVLFSPGGASESTLAALLAETQRISVPVSLAVTGPVSGQVIAAGVSDQKIRLLRNAGHVDPELSDGVYPLVTLRLGGTVVYRDKLEAGLPWSETVSFLSETGDALTIDVDQSATVYLNMRLEYVT